MQIFLITSALFAVSLATHLIIWRVRCPDQQIRALLIIFAAVFGLWLAGGRMFSMTIVDVLHVALFYLSISLCYVITYSAIEADSPTLSLIRFLADAKTQGRSMDEIRRFMALRPFVRARLAALARSGLIREEGSRYVAVGQPPLSFRVILGFRRLYGPISKGG